MPNRQPLPTKAERMYSNSGNKPLLDLLPDCSRILDIGCGVGDNARVIKMQIPGCKVYGITHSEKEANFARKVMDGCWVMDLEAQDQRIHDQRFDVLLLSHVLEHLRNPAEVLNRYLDVLEDGGRILIAVPNILSWRMRIKFLRGQFEYASSGELDDTHLRFYTYFTAETLLLAGLPQVEVISKTVTGSFPLFWLRRHLLPIGWCAVIDQWACKRWPNLFGSQILLHAKKLECP